jgi:hypothetical protein
MTCYQSLKTDVIALTVRNKQKTYYFLHLGSHCHKQKDPDPQIQCTNPDPYKNVTDPEHCPVQ